MNATFMLKIGFELLNILFQLIVTVLDNQWQSLNRSTIDSLWRLADAHNIGYFSFQAEARGSGFVGRENPAT